MSSILDIPKDKQAFELDYVDGRQLFVGLVSEVSFNTTQTSGEFSCCLKQPNYHTLKVSVIVTHLKSNTNP